MRRIIIILLAVIICVPITGCSVIEDILGTEKYEMLSNKLSAAWENVGKDALSTLTDDIWREYGFGKSIDWPAEGIGSGLPKFRDGKVSSYFDESSGYIKIEDISDGELDEYIDTLGKIGYNSVDTKEPFNVMLVFDGTYVGFIRTSDSECSMLYASSVEKLENLLELGNK